MFHMEVQLALDYNIESKVADKKEVSIKIIAFEVDEEVVRINLLHQKGKRKEQAKKDIEVDIN